MAFNPSPKVRTPSSYFDNRGSALLLVLWALVLLSMAVFGIVEIVEANVTHSSHLELQSQARALARSGLAVALDPDIPETDSLLKQEPNPGQKWAVTMKGEAGRLNLNSILLNGHKEILQRLFLNWGMNQGDAMRLIDCLYDWITPGNKPSPQGAKEADYRRAGLTHFPTGQPFESLPEVAMVLHMDDLEKARPDWQDSFTLLSDGGLDVNEAPAELLSVVLNIPASQAQTFVAIRNGKDGIQGTADDVPIKDVAGLKAALGLSDHDINLLGNQIAYTDNVRRLESKGEAGGVVVTISAVTRLRTSPPTFLQWTEL